WTRFSNLGRVYCSQSEKDRKGKTAWPILIKTNDAARRFPPNPADVDTIQRLKPHAVKQVSNASMLDRISKDCRISDRRCTQAMQRDFQIMAILAILAFMAISQWFIPLWGKRSQSRQNSF